jgi:hypothetical protein
MSAPRSEDRVWEEHMERWRRVSRRTPMHRAPERSSLEDVDARQARASELSAAAPGRLGRLLLSDIEPYLEFFALARPGVDNDSALFAPTDRGTR